MQAFKSEIKKGPIYLRLCVTGGFLLLVYAWLIIDFMHATPTSLAVGWNSIQFDLSVLNVILCPIFLTVIANRITEPDHKGEMFKTLFTIQSRGQLYHAKLLLGLIHCLIFCIGQTGIMFIISIQYGITQVCPVTTVLLNLFLTFIVTYAGYILMLIISLLFRHPAVAFSVGIGSSLVGTFFLYCSTTWMRYLFFWTNYTTLSLYSMEYDEVNRSCVYNALPLNPLGILTTVTFAIIFYLTGALWLRRKEY